MICLRCGYCCKNMFVPIVDDPAKGPEKGNIVVHEGKGDACQHLLGDHPGEYFCMIHDESWYPQTPCSNHTQVERTETECRMGRYILNPSLGEVMMNHKELLKKQNPCLDAFDWYANQDSQEAWESCCRADWMLWIAAKLEVDRKLIVLAACDCAETSLKFISEGEERPQKAIEIVRLWAEGKATIEEVRTAADAADAAADAYAVDAAVDAADAAYAAAAAAYAVDAAAYAVDAVDAAADAAAYAVDAAAAQKESLANSARLVRQRIPWQWVEEAIAND